MMADDDPDRLYPWKRWHTPNPQEVILMAEDRARSFIERYVIARAPAFRVGQEKEDAHAAALDGKSVYRNIANVAKTAEPPPDMGVSAQQAGVAQGQTGPSHTHANPISGNGGVKLSPGGIVAGPPPGAEGAIGSVPAWISKRFFSGGKRT